MAKRQKTVYQTFEICFSSKMFYARQRRTNTCQAKNAFKLFENNAQRIPLTVARQAIFCDVAKRSNVA